MKPNTVQVYRKTAYGVERIYPANLLAQTLAAFKDAASFTYRDLKILQDLGYEIKEVFSGGPLNKEDKDGK